jgi:hypothetical protein
VQELNAKMDNVMMFLQLAKPDVSKVISLTIQEASFLNLSKFYTIRQTRMNCLI